MLPGIKVGDRMRYPCLIQKQMCTTPVKIEIEQEDINEYGEPLDSVNVEVKCNYQDRAKTVLTAEKKLITLSGVALIPGDIAPELPVISGGSITVFDKKRKIYQGIKARNPDGTVNYTEVQVQ